MMQLPDGPRTPALLSMMQWIADPFAFMDACARRYGDFFSVPLGRKFHPVVFVSNPQTLQEILANDTKQFEAPGEMNELFRPLLGDRGVIMVSGDRHRRERQLLMPPFHGERMRAYGQLIVEITEQVIGEWSLNQPFSVRASMQTISLRVILQAVFGLEAGPRYQQLEQLLSAMLEAFRQPLSATLLYFPFLQRDLGPFSPWAIFQRQRQEVDQLLYAEIQARRAQPDPSRTDILTLLLSARDQAGEPMSDVELHDELMTLLVAGHETTATALTWALYWIHQLPSVKANLLQELDNHGDRSDLNALFRLPYLNAVCSETLRIYPVGMLTFPRVVRTKLQLQGCELEPGPILIGCIYLTHQRPDIYPEPKKFQPERFLTRQFSPYEFLPFGGGSRRCIGMAFALFEMKVVLSKILSTWQLALANNRPVKPLRRGLTAAPSSVRLVATKQRQPSRPLVSQP